MSTLLARSLAAANLDLLLLGALADKMRAAERGGVVRLFLDRPQDEVLTFGAAELAAAGDAHAWLRTIAIARLSGAGGPIRVDGGAVGLQLAQVALAFGADEIVASAREHHGRRLALYGGDDATAREQEVLREREIVSLIADTGRSVRVIDQTGERAPDETTPAVRRFRAPGREKWELGEV